MSGTNTPLPASVSDHRENPGLRLVALLNAAAGAASQKSPDGLRAELASALDAVNAVAEIKFCGGAELKALAEAALASAKAGEIDAVVVGGGDGSIRTVAGVLAGSDVPLGILPLGTLNHFARDLGIPLNVEAAAEIIARGKQRSVDLAEVNSETFINNSSIGVYPYIVLDRERRRAHHKLKKWMAMVPALFRAARHFPRRRLALSAEGWTRPYRTPCLLIGNNEYGMEFPTLGRRDRLDQAELSVYVVKQRRAFGFFWMIWRMAFGKISAERDIEKFRLKDLLVRSKTSRLPVALDGEVEFMHPPLEFRTRPAALRVIVPQAPFAKQPHAR
jgi:diacylglycerol kinase family enzyme